MPLSGTRLKTALAADILSQLQSKFPVSGSLLPAEQTLQNTAQSDLATAIANGSGPDIVTEIVTNTLVTVPGITTGPATAVGTVT